MKLLKILLLLFLSGCSLQYGDHKPNEPYYIKRTVRVINSGICSKAFTIANQYFTSHGIVVTNSRDSDYALVCIQDASLLVRIFRNLFDPLQEPHGLVYGQAGWVKIKGNPEDDAKVIIHELSHLLFNVEHQSSGIMFPFAEGLIFATGLDDETLKNLKH